MAEQRRYRSAAPAPKVLYIGGTGRTGSTLLTRLLGEVPGWFPAGELAFLWRHGLVGGGRCSCGHPVRSCPVWGAVVDEVEDGVGPVDAERMVGLRRKCWSMHLPIMAIPGVAQPMMRRLAEFPDVVEATYRSLAAVTGSRLIVDSSKEPHYSWILRDRTDLEVYFLHLVRDPRAVAHSWSRHRIERGRADGTEMDRRRPLRASVYYDVSNVAAEAIWGRARDRYRFMRYEDFVADPQAALDAIADFVGEPVAASPLVGRSFATTEHHIAWGNPNRFDAGVVDIRPDAAWRGELGRRAGWAMTAATLGLAGRYGYPLRRSRTRRPVRARRLRSALIPEAET